MLTKLAPYRKTAAALIVGLIGWGTAVVQSAPTSVTGAEWIGLATVVAVALGVYAAPNVAPEG